MELTPFEHVEFRHEEFSVSTFFFFEYIALTMLLLLLLNKVSYEFDI